MSLQYDQEWLAKQRSISDQRDRARAQQCDCGHLRGQHAEDVASCMRCKCCSFREVQS